MNTTTNRVKNALSLRYPQADSLLILEHIADIYLGKQDGKVPLMEQEELLKEVHKAYPIFKEYERNFPSFCFALATGVGKTRLAGAFVAYLYLKKKVRNFFILAPNLTIYNKLIKDFSDSSNPKYVFNGIGELQADAVNIITGDNYKDKGPGQLNMFGKININVFNISKINSEARGGATPKIRSMNEVLGEPYFNYLKGLDDLVMIMDESHHYRANRGMQVLNELNPLLGLELTATPQIEKGKNSVKFKNVVYEYSLAKAIKDGFVKTPAIATRKDFNPKKYSPDDLDALKLEDGLRIHEITKADLDIFARNNDLPFVKPFVLVVAKETNHAAKIKAHIQSKDFFEGRYADKVMEIHSNQRGKEKDENIEQLVSLEHPDNRIEIVIHVNMLKEGWDVTNLYTIVPLRTATSMTLREQTIGRGLRLPYGTITGDTKVDRLTIIAHDKFQEIVDAANRPDSIINQENIIVLDEEELQKPTEVVVAPNKVEAALQKEEEEIAKIENPEERAVEQTRVKIDRLITEEISEMGRTVANIQELTHEESKKIAIENVKKKLEQTPQLFGDELVKQIEERYAVNVERFQANTIEIPRITITVSEDIDYGFHDFDLDTKYFGYTPLDATIQIHSLQSKATEYIDASGQKRYFDSLENVIINELINFGQVDYDKDAHLLYKLSTQAVDHLKDTYKLEEVHNIIQHRKREIGNFIYAQLKENFYMESAGFDKAKIDVRAYSVIRDHNLSKYKADDIFPYHITITPSRDIPKKIFHDFTKACHSHYKFDSKTEKDFATICEKDETVQKWLRPAKKQFYIYYANNAKLYEPDFIVETADAIYMVETKAEKDMNTDLVKEKAKSACEYCKNATRYTSENNGKPWVYVLIPHNEVQFNMSIAHLFKKFTYEV